MNQVINAATARPEAGRGGALGAAAKAAAAHPAARRGGMAREALSSLSKNFGCQASNKICISATVLYSGPAGPGPRACATGRDSVPLRAQQTGSASLSTRRGAQPPGLGLGNRKNEKYNLRILAEKNGKHNSSEPLLTDKIFIVSVSIIVPIIKAK